MMIIDIHNHNFDVCPMCKSMVLVIRIKEEEINADMIASLSAYNNRRQRQMLRDYCREHGIAMTPEELSEAA